MDDESISLSRRTTQSDLAPFEARPVLGAGLERASSPLQNPSLPNVGLLPQRPTVPSRQATQSSVNSLDSHTSNTPLLSSAADIGRGGQARAFSPGPGGYRPPPSRGVSGMSARSQDGFQSRPSRMGPPLRQNTGIKQISKGARKVLVKLRRTRARLRRSFFALWSFK